MRKENMVLTCEDFLEEIHEFLYDELDDDRNTELDILYYFDFSVISRIKSEMNFQNKDFLVEQLKICADDIEKNFRHLLFNVLCMIRDNNMSEEGMNHLVNHIHDNYDTELLNEKYFYVLLTSMADSNQDDVTNCMMGCIDINKYGYYSSSLMEIVNNVFKGVYRTSVPLLLSTSIRESLKCYSEGSMFKIKNQVKTSEREMRIQKYTLNKSIEEDD